MTVRPLFNVSTAPPSTPCCPETIPQPYRPAPCQGGSEDKNESRCRFAFTVPTSVLSFSDFGTR